MSLCPENDESMLENPIQTSVPLYPFQRVDITNVFQIIFLQYFRDVLQGINLKYLDNNYIFCVIGRSYYFRWFQIVFSNNADQQLTATQKFGCFLKARIIFQCVFDVTYFLMLQEFVVQFC